MCVCMCFGDRAHESRWITRHELDFRCGQVTFFLPGATCKLFFAFLKEMFKAKPPSSSYPPKDLDTTLASLSIGQLSCVSQLKRTPCAQSSFLDSFFQTLNQLFYYYSVFSFPFTKKKFYFALFLLLYLI